MLLPLTPQGYARCGHRGRHRLELTTIRIAAISARFWLCVSNDFRNTLHSCRRYLRFLVLEPKRIMQNHVKSWQIMQNHAPENA